jgi:dihydrolipoamide dehydrogenase
VFTRNQGLDIELEVQIFKVSQSKKGITVQYDTKDKSSKTFDCDRLIVSVGRVPNTDDLGAENVGLKLDAKGFIEVDKNCRTALPRIYAVGDVVRGPMLAHKGEDEGVMVAEIIAGQHGHVNYDAIPWVMYTAPEIAWVGKTEKEVKDSGRGYKTGTFPFAASGRAKAMEQTAGLVKIVAAADDDELLGVHILGPMAGELIAEAVLAMEFSASSEDLQRTIHAHPSLAEAVHEAALAVDNRALNNINK